MKREKRNLTCGLCGLQLLGMFVFTDMSTRVMHSGHNESHHKHCEVKSSPAEEEEVLLRLKPSGALVWFLLSSRCVFCLQEFKTLVWTLMILISLNMQQLTHTLWEHTHTHTHTAGEICGVFSVQQERNINSLNALKIRIHLVHFIVFIYFFIGTDTKWMWQYKKTSNIWHKERKRKNKQNQWDLFSISRHVSAVIGAAKCFKAAQSRGFKMCQSKNNKTFMNR